MDRPHFRSRLLLVALTLLALAIASSPRPALADELDDLIAAGEPVLFELPDPIDLDAEPMPQDGAQALAFGTPRLRAGNHASYIDRVELPDFARRFYDYEVEATDGDGVNDWLIEDRYFQRTGANDSTGIETPGTVFPVNGGYGVSLGCIGDDSMEDVSACLRAAGNAFYWDHPEVFWSGGFCSWGYWAPHGRKKYVFAQIRSDKNDGHDPSYPDEAAIRAAIALCDSQVRAIMAGTVTMGANDYTRIRHFNRWLTTHNEYNSVVAAGGDSPTSATGKAITGLVGKSGPEGPVCLGYAKSFKVLCDAAGIPCTCCSGWATDKDGNVLGGHVWNQVGLFGSWYYVDVTWDDPTRGRETENYLLVGADTVIGDTSFEGSHRMTNNGCLETNFKFINQPITSPGAFQASMAPKQVSVRDAQVSVPACAYTGQPLTPAPTVTLGGVELKPGVDYFATYSNNVNAGKGSLTVTGMEGYTGTRTVSFPIAKAKPSLSLPSPIALDPDEGEREVAVGGAGGRSVSVSSSDTKVVRASSAGQGLKLVPVSKGTATLTVRVAGDANHEAASAKVPVHVDDVLTVWRLYNPTSGEHLWTADANEYATLDASAAWQGEGAGWRAPVSGSTVRRLYHPTSGKHLYTADANEVRTLLASGQGWRDEGACWHSDASRRAPVYRLYNPWALFEAAHHLTPDFNEYASLGRAGWHQEGTCWYAVGM